MLHEGGALPLADALRPDWPAPASVGALMSTRAGGVSAEPFASLNLRPPRLRGDSVDDVQAVHENQRRFAIALGATPVYLDQVHGARVVRIGAGDVAADAPMHRADAAVCTEPGVACTVLVADCLPVLFAAPHGRAVGAAHAGWRGLAAGVLDATVDAVCGLSQCEPGELVAWFGACIGPRRFEVGADVLNAFGPLASSHFVEQAARGHSDRRPRWLADLPGLARDRLLLLGVSQVSGGRWCTVEDASRFFSFRRDRVTGRHAAAVWIRGAPVC